VALRYDEPYAGQAYHKLEGKVDGDQLRISGSVEGESVSATIRDGVMTGSGGGGRARMQKVDPASPTLGAKPLPGAVALLPSVEGKEADLSGFATTTWVAMEDGSMRVESGEAISHRAFGDIMAHVEFRVPPQPTRTGQDRGNSGVYLQERYEVQVLDSFGLDSKDNDCGGLYEVAKPARNACFPPGTWQTYDLVFRSARLGADGKVSEAPRLTVFHNGVRIHDRQQLPPEGTRLAAKGLVDRGALRLQDHGQPVRYRNIWVLELKGAEADRSHQIQDFLAR